MSGNRIAALAIVVLVAACRGATPAPRGIADSKPVDPRITPETRALFHNLQRVRREHVMFGHQDDLAYGFTWNAQPGRSDVKETAGAYPAVYGFELGHLELDSARTLDEVSFEKMRGWIAEAYGRGVVITVSWHLNHPVSGGSAWDTTRAVVAVLPGGAQHQKYLGWLDRVATFLGSLQGSKGEPIPVVFRPYHETSGNWFWWGGRHRTPNEYVQLWRMTVRYLRDTKGLHNLLWAYSTDVFSSEQDYLRQYPGDDWVDVMGFDDYQSVRRPGDPALPRRLRELVQTADAHGKVPVMSETGLAGVPDPQWWTGTLLSAIKADTVGRHIAWVLVWRNATNYQHGDKVYAPYPGHPSAADFVRFYKDPLILFEDELPHMYVEPKAAAAADASP